MLAAGLLLLGLYGAQPAADSRPLGTPLVEQERRPLPVALLQVGARTAHVSRSDLLRVLADVIERSTAYRLQELDPASFETCRGRLGCLVKLALDAARDPRSKHALILTQVSRGDGPDQLSALLIDISTARVLVQQESAEGLELAIQQKAIAAPEQQGELRDEDDTRSFGQRLSEGPFKAAFEAAGVLEASAVLELECNVPGLQLSIDGRAIGATVAGVTRIERVVGGRRKIGLDGSGYLSWSSEAEANPGEVTHLKATPEAEAKSGTYLRSGVIIGGVVVAVTGTAILSYGLLASPAADRICAAHNVDGCPSGANWLRFGFAGKDDLDPNADANGSGPAIVPLGLALLGTGAVWGLGAWLLSEENEIPWLPVLAGIALGVVTYGALLLVEPSS